MGYSCRLFAFHGSYSLPAADHHLHLPRHLFTTNFRTSRSSRPSYFQPTMASSISWSARLTIAAVFLLGLCQHAAAQYTVHYAFAVVQWQTCWCTDYAPSSSTSGCTLDCPGWQEEKCGNTDPSLYGYISLPASVSGTRGPSAATSSSANQNTASTTTTRRSSTTSSTSSTWTPTPVTSLETITGQVR